MYWMYISLTQLLKRRRYQWQTLSYNIIKARDSRYGTILASNVSIYKFTFITTEPSKHTRTLLYYVLMYILHTQYLKRKHYRDSTYGTILAKKYQSSISLPSSWQSPVKTHARRCIIILMYISLPQPLKRRHYQWKTLSYNIIKSRDSKYGTILALNASTISLPSSW